MFKTRTIAATALAGLLAGIAIVKSQGLPRAAYTMQMQMITYNTDSGQPQYQKLITIANYQNGTTARVMPDGIMEVINPHSRTVTVYDPAIRAYHTSLLSAQAAANRISPLPAKCATAAGFPCAPGPDVLGVKTYVVENGSPCPTGDCKTNRFIVLLSPELNWEAVDTETWTGSGKLAHTGKAISIVRGEPAIPLDVFQGYAAEQDMVKFLEKGLAARAVTLNPQTAAELQRLDAQKQASIEASYGVLARLRLAVSKLLSAVL